MLKVKFGVNAVARKGSIVKVKPITHKMKNRVREHGEIWLVDAKEGNKYSITPLNPINHEFPYACWITNGLEAEIEDLK